MSDNVFSRDCCYCGSECSIHSQTCKSCASSRMHVVNIAAAECLHINQGTLFREVNSGDYVEGCLDCNMPWFGLGKQGKMYLHAEKTQDLRAASCACKKELTNIVCDCFKCAERRVERDYEKKEWGSKTDRCLLLHPSEDGSMYYSWVPADLVTQEVADTIVVNHDLAIDLVTRSGYSPEEAREAKAKLPECLQPLWGQVRSMDGEHWGGTLHEGYTKVLTIYDWC